MQRVPNAPAPTTRTNIMFKDTLVFRDIHYCNTSLRKHVRILPISWGAGDTAKAYTRLVENSIERTQTPLYHPDNSSHIYVLIMYTHMQTYYARRHKAI